MSFWSKIFLSLLIGALTISISGAPMAATRGSPGLYHSSDTINNNATSSALTLATLNDEEGPQVAGLFLNLGIADAPGSIFLQAVVTTIITDRDTTPLPADQPNPDYSNAVAINYPGRAYIPAIQRSNPATTPQTRLTTSNRRYPGQC